MLDHSSHGDLTTVSFSPDPPAAPDRREGARHISVLRVATLRTPHGEEFCLVRNISSGGLMAHIYSPLEVGDAVTTEFKSGHAVSGRVVWRREGLAGVQFGEEIDVTRVLSDKVDDAPASHQARAPRVALALRARIRVGAFYHAVSLCDISQGGAKIRLGKPEEVRRKLVLTVTGLPAIAGSICWCDGDFAGIAFDRPIPFETLARWVSEVQATAEQDGSAG